jgi:Zn-dependent M28 family amino/carboxypeptidase
MIGKNFPAGRTMRRYAIIFLPFFVISSSGGADFDAGRAWGHLQAQLAFGPRNPGGEGHRLCLQYLETELKKYADTLNLQRFDAVIPGTSQTVSLSNVIAGFHPQHSRKILLCAHWDTRPWADQDADPQNRDKPIPGANDGASGVAVLLEIARCLAAQDPGVAVEIALFDGEDMGREGHLDEYLLGSREYASRLQLPLPEAALLLDLVGDRDLSIPQELYSLQNSAALVREVFAVAASLGKKEFEPRPGTAVYDDHIPLIQAGIPAVNLVDFNYEFWHTLEDVAENCSAASLQAVGDVVLAWVYQRGKS